MKLLKQILDSLCSKAFSVRECSFKKIVGNDDTKLILNKALLSKQPIHILLVGPPGSAKTLFLTEIMRSLKNSYFIVGSNTTKSGLVNQLFEKEPKYLLIDELDKMNGNDQTSLLHLMETGLISETKIGKTRQMELVSWVFATANCYNKIIEPLLSRFVVLEIQEYSFEEFVQITVSRLGNENIDKFTAMFIAKKVWYELNSRDVRDLLKVGSLADTFADVESIIRIMKGHSQKVRN
jgi:MoxR-like ATPase